MVVLNPVPVCDEPGAVAVDVDEVADEMAILFVQGTSEGVVKLLERATSVHCRTILIRLQDCPGSGLPGSALHHRHCIALELSHSPRPWYRRN